jgi:hypothetical protein
MDSTYETAEVDLNPDKQGGISTPQIDPINQLNSLPVNTLKEKFGVAPSPSPSQDNSNKLFIIIGIISVALFFVLKNKT